MSEATRELTRKTRFWKELREGWVAFQAGQRDLPLEEETRGYFVNLTGVIFNEALNSVSHAREVPRPSPEDAWTHVLGYFLIERPESGKILLDDIFKSGREKATEAGVTAGWERMDLFLGWVINQFTMRVREAAVNDYLREHGKASLRQATTSGDRKVSPSGGEGDSEASLFDLMARQEAAFSEVEREELGGLGSEWSESFFPSVRMAFRITLYLRFLRVDRGVIVACTDDRVLKVAKVGSSVLSSGYDKTRQSWKDYEGSQPAWQELDPEARVFVDGVGWVSVLELSESWFWSEKAMEPLYSVINDKLDALSSPPSAA